LHPTVVKRLNGGWLGDKLGSGGGTSAFEMLQIQIHLTLLIAILDIEEVSLTEASLRLVDGKPLLIEQLPEVVRFAPRALRQTLSRLHTQGIGFGF
jgi:hypothetical protein